MNVSSAAVALALLALACSKPTDTSVTALPSASASASPSASPTPPASASASPSASASASASASPPASGSASASKPAAPLHTLAGFPPTAAGAKALVSELVKPGVDAAAFTKLLRPTTADYRSIFDAPTATKIDAVYSAEWERGSFVVSARPGQTEVKISSATVADLKANNEKAKEFPSGYAKVASHLVGNSTLYRFRFVEPGQEQGNSYDGLVHVNGHWVLIPKPWRALDDHR